jgi:hypothetical protein
VYIDISEKAKKYIKAHEKDLVHKFACKDLYPPVTVPSTYFMAGSPGAGKTEWSQSFITSLIEKEPNRKIVRLDPDEVRASIEGYIPEKADLFQGATGIGVQKILDSVFHMNQDLLLDGTFSNYKLAHQNITLSLQKNRKVGILYIYQDPIIAWDFTKKRAALERRIVPKKAFIEAYFNAKANVNQAKKEFGKKIEIWLVIKNGLQQVQKIYFNVDGVDNYIKMEYNAKTLEEILL